MATPVSRRSSIPRGLRQTLIALTALVCLPACAQTAGAAAGHSVPRGSTPVVVGEYSPETIAELVAPIALYPDDLLAIVLPASSYPLQIVQAARFLEEAGQDANAKPDEAWDDSVVALLNYPEVVRLLNDDLDWTWQLGQAVLAQEADVLAAIEDFRDRAYVAGNLRTDERQVVAREDGAIYIRPADPQVIHVPYYEPAQMTVYHRYPVYHYYPRAYPVYYYPYPLGYVFPGGFFYGVTTFYSLGWSARHLYAYDYHYHAHPFYGRPGVYFYNDYYYRQPRKVVHNHYYGDHHRKDYRDHDYRWRHDGRTYDRRDWERRAGNRPRDGRDYQAGRRDGNDNHWRDGERDRQDGSNGWRDGGSDRHDAGRDRPERGWQGGDRGQREDARRDGDRPRHDRQDRERRPDGERTREWRGTMAQAPDARPHARPDRAAPVQPRNPPAGLEARSPQFQADGRTRSDGRSDRAARPERNDRLARMDNPSRPVTQRGDPAQTLALDARSRHWQSAAAQRPHAERALSERNRSIDQRAPPTRHGAVASAQPGLDTRTQAHARFPRDSEHNRSARATDRRATMPTQRSAPAAPPTATDAPRAYRAQAQIERRTPERQQPRAERPSRVEHVQRNERQDGGDRSAQLARGPVDRGVAGGRGASRDR